MRDRQDVVRAQWQLWAVAFVIIFQHIALRNALGWELHDDTLCNDAMCVPLPAGSRLGEDGIFDLADVSLHQMHVVANVQLVERGAEASLRVVAKEMVVSR